MVSDVFDSLLGFVRLSDSEWKSAHDRVAKMPVGPLKQALQAKLPEQQAARVIFNSGIHGDAVEERNIDHGLPGSNWANNKGYWDNRSFTRQVNLLLRIFEIKYPMYECVLIVDNSSGHYAKSHSELNATLMNASAGGKQPKMHDGYYFALDANGQQVRVTQPMCDGLKDFHRVVGKPDQGLPTTWYRHKVTGKIHETVPQCATALGLRAVLTERFNRRAIKVDGTLAKDPSALLLAEMRIEMSMHRDFNEIPSRVERLCQTYSAKHTALFLPKFHPEAKPDRAGLA
jgi:hypothetical protein